MKMKMKTEKIQKMWIVLFIAIFSSQNIAFSADTSVFQAHGIYLYAGDKRIVMEENGEKFFILRDHLGSTTSLIDSTGQEVNYTEYESFGKIKSETGTKTLSKKFTGKELDLSTGLYDYDARQYDPQIKRFITPDPLEWRDVSLRSIDGKGLQEFLMNPQNLNRYSYTLNNPLKYLDLSGQKVELAEKSVAGFGRHRYLILTPDNPADFKDNPRFTTPQGGPKVTTVSGQPERPCPDCGNLVSRPNSDLNSEILARVTISSPQKGISDTEFIKAILKAEGSYKNDLEYKVFPKRSSGYNSNSFARGILGSVGIQQLPNLSGFAPDFQAPGFNKPIPLPPVLVSGGNQNQSSQTVVKKSPDTRSVFIS